MAKNKLSVFGLKPLNQEQSDAITALLDCSIDLVVLEGGAGSGKSLITIAACLEMILENRMYKEIVYTRSPVAVGGDLGHLPGELEDKLKPWATGLEDSIEFLLTKDDLTEKIIYSKIKQQSLAHIRGRSLVDRVLVVEEAQNLSFQELKVILTRASQGTKVIVCGDRQQIDNKKLNSENNGLSMLIEGIEYNPQEFIKYVHLTECVRSRLCNWVLTV